MREESGGTVSGAPRARATFAYRANLRAPTPGLMGVNQIKRPNVGVRHLCVPALCARGCALPRSVILTWGPCMQCGETRGGPCDTITSLRGKHVTESVTCTRSLEQSAARSQSDVIDFAR